MFHVEASAFLPFPPEAVLAAAGSVESTLRWQVGVLGVRRARHGKGRPSAALVVSYYALGERHALAAHVVRSDPPRHFAYRACGPAFTLDVALDAAPVLGGTRVVYRLWLATAPPAPGDAHAERRPAALRRLLGRRAPRDLLCLEAYVARRAGGVGRLPHIGLQPAAPLAALDALAPTPLHAPAAAAAYPPSSAT